jgi:hypothetical protein
MMTENIPAEPIPPVNENLNPIPTSELPPANSPIETPIAPLEIPASEPVIKPPARGRHPKGCNCGKCIQSGGTGGYEKGGTKRKATSEKLSADGDTSNYDQGADFSDVTGGEPRKNENVLPVNPAGVNYDALAAMTFDLTVGTLTTVFGPEWQPKSTEEKSSVVIPLSAYMKSKNFSDLPPGMVLCVMVIAYSSTRLQAPNTKQKLAGAWMWLKSKLFRRK